MLVQRSGTLALSSLNNVFMSLTKNAKSIYLIIVKYQLENKKSQHYEGLLFKDLYWACREAFLVSSDLALRAQLTEFVDHKMVKFKRSISGGEHLIIPLQNSLLQQFVDEQPV
ncbi:origin recognition complex subunit 2-like [Agrilus planipennis]|nr:origin recognition complex subunit 2-like [Agrilus planipennis]